jgi:hypothetical protein
LATNGLTLSGGLGDAVLASGVTNLTVGTGTFTMNGLPSGSQTSLVGFNTSTKALNYQSVPYVWGSFSSTAPQAVSGVNTTTFASYDTQDVTPLNCSYSGSDITVGVACSKIRIQSSLIVTSGANNTTFLFWLVKNGTNVANSASTVIIKDNGDQTLQVCEWYDSCAANDIYKIAYQADDATASLVAVAAGGTAPNNYPATPSIITTVIAFA